MTGTANSFQTAFRANETEARCGICAVIAWLRAAGIDDDLAGSVEIALAEAINNVVEHAYAGRAPGDISVAADMAGSDLHVEIVDSGVGLPENRLPAGEQTDLTGPLETLPEGGFGWFLIRQLTRDLSYQRHNGCNRLSLCFDLARVGG